MGQRLSGFLQFVVALGLCGLLGFAWVGARAAWYDMERLDPVLEGRDVQVVGVVREMTRSNPAGLRFRLELESAVLDGQAVHLPSRIDLGWYKGMAPRSSPADLGDWELQKQPQAMAPGERWRMTVRVKAPHGGINFQGFDYELWLWEQGVQATGYVRAGVRDAPPQRLEQTNRFPVDRLRQRLREHIFMAVGDPSQAGLLAALTVGDQSAIEQSNWAVFRATGVAHLVSISGLHITMFAWAARWLMAWLWRRSQTLCLWWPAGSAAWVGGMIVASAYAVFAGWGIPAQRTCIMLAWVSLLRLSGARWPWPYVWILALVLVVLYDPWSLLQPGFWLSFVAVAILFATDSDAPQMQPKANAPLPRHFDWRTRLHALAQRLGVPRRPNAALMQSDPRDALFSHSPTAEVDVPDTRTLALRFGWSPLRRVLREQGLITLALAPLTLVLFGQVSLVGLLANVVAVPWVTLVITPLALIGILFEPLWQWAALAADIWIGLMQTMAAWPLAVLTLPVPPWWLALSAGIGAFLLVLPLPWTLRLCGLPLVLALGVWRPLAPPHGQFDWMAADIGQGNAVIVRTQQHALLYDAGPRYSLESDAGQRVLLPMLQAQALMLDRVVLSHRDSDHVGGAASVFALQPQAQLWSSLEDGHPLLQGRESVRCQAGQSWDWDGVHFEFLHPTPEAYVAQPVLKPNALSCVLRVQARGGRTALLVGDIEKPQELQLLARAAQYPERASLAADLLLVPHHGSKTSSSAEFLSAVHPQTVVVQAGYRNRYGHPAAPVVQRYRDLGQTYAPDTPLKWVDSAHCGAFFWQSWHPEQSKCARQELKRYWHHQVP